MNPWKKAFQLSLLELRESTRGFLTLIFFYAIITLYLIISMPSYLEKNFLGVDILFLIAFSLAPTWARPKHFQIQKSQHGFIVPSVIMLQHLPIPKDIILKSRIIVHSLYTLPVQILLLLFLYLLSEPLQDMMSFGTYLVFMTIWLMFGIYVGGMFLVGDMGDDTPLLKSIMYTILLLIITVSVLLAINLISAFGIVNWTIIFAKDWPMISTIVSIILAWLGSIYWYRYMKTQLKKLDYM